MQKKLFTELGLSKEVLKAVAKMGFEEATPIQSEAIPPLLEGRDVVGQSQTGSGKTAAFAIPAIERVDASTKAQQVLMLCPTRELAVQVAEEVAKLAMFKPGVRELPIYGGQSYTRQFRGLELGAQIVIGTPGRVMDHLDRKSLKLDSLKMVVLDEADRMLDMGFLDDIKTILRHAPADRQTVLFSATLPGPIKSLIKDFTRDPVNLEIKSQSLTVPAIDQVYYEVDRRSKLEVLCRLIDLQDVRFGIIFCATKMMVDELTDHLMARGYSADKLHGDISQAAREKVMAKFRKRRFEFLVATDVAARGLDVDDIEVVFNYDLPHDGEDYVHRIGRTGRAGRSGRAVTFVAGREIYKLQNIIRFTKGKIRREHVPSAEEVEEKRANVFFETLRETLEKGEYAREDEMIGRLLDQGHAPTDIASALISMLGGEKSRADEKGAAEGAKSPGRDGRDGRGGSDRDFDRGSDRGFDRGADRGFEPEFGGQDSHTGRHQNPESTVSHESGMVRLAMNVGRRNQIRPGDIVGVIVGAAKVPKNAVGAIILQQEQSLVDVAEDCVKGVLKKLNGIQFKGTRLAIGLAGAEFAEVQVPEKPRFEKRRR
jgi:ATP-dependent RNA helicase DeaD